ncbi:hypothetical protein [Elstera sp.]|jgi:hypothetical protein|uniref:hypothetical protein n=1 Tax=Elstera sp. TaxID=1916664 RepID=UPI0037BF08C2
MSGVYSALAGDHPIVAPTAAGLAAVRAAIATLTVPPRAVGAGGRALDHLRLHDAAACRAILAALARVRAVTSHTERAAAAEACLAMIVTAWPNRSLADAENYKQSLGVLLLEHPPVVCGQAVDDLTRGAKRFPARPDLARALKQVAADHAELGRLAQLHLDEWQYRDLHPPPKAPASAAEREAEKARVRALLMGAFGPGYLKTERKRR